MSADPEDKDALMAAHKARQAEQDAMLRARYPEIGAYLDDMDETFRAFTDILSEENADLRSRISTLKRELGASDAALVYVVETGHLHRPIYEAYEAARRRSATWPTFPR